MEISDLLFLESPRPAPRAAHLNSLFRSNNLPSFRPTYPSPDPPPPLRRSALLAALSASLPESGFFIQIAVRVPRNESFDTFNWPDPTPDPRRAFAAREWFPLAGIRRNGQDSPSIRNFRPSPMNSYLPRFARLAVLALLLFSLPARGEDMTDAAFGAMLENATLEGTWAPVAGKQIGEEKADRYEVARAEPKGGEKWAIVWKVRHQGQLVEYPIPAVVKFAGDAAVLVLDGVPVGDGGTWSARVLFHGDSYAGRWWNEKGKGGTVSGVIRRP